MVKFLIILLVIWLVSRYILPVVLRLVVGALVKKQAQKFGQQFGQNPFTQPPRPSASRSGSAPGEVHVDYVPPQEKAEAKGFKGGEYIDFEEVK
ncbi:DUF4834 family protein [Hymenobacter psychrophilus]|uniref:DUF4834 domain-containing protein n=1 Tax=Hymenobacter psychrophilus TaxID=651662 RepID=A0A1H3MKF4_9BACT|nr:DUF4834 family protein [Hymenobacter psychrophilus]SDY76585.1 protein of unknown function [Hymenobacter psychrophilus]